MKNDMKFHIKSDGSKVTFAMRTGKVFVTITTLLTHANRILRNGKDVEISDARGYGKEICVDDTYFFPTDDKADEVTDNE